MSDMFPVPILIPTDHSARQQVADVYHAICCKSYFTAQGMLEEILGYPRSAAHPPGSEIQAPSPSPDPAATVALPAEPGRESLDVEGGGE